MKSVSNGQPAVEEARPALSPSRAQVIMAVQQPWQTEAAASDPPPNLDAASFIAGERAAWIRAFQATLPGQQAIGQLFAVVDNLQIRLEQEADASRLMQLEHAKAMAILEATVKRLDGLEDTQLPSMQQKWEDLVSRPAISPDVTEALQQLKFVLNNLSEQQQQQMKSSSILQQLHWMIATASGYSAKVISQADVAAVFLSRKILLTDIVQIQTSKQQAAISAAMLVLMIEAAWQIHERVTANVPMTRSITPVRSGLRAVRVAVWTAAFILSFKSARTTCVEASDRLLTQYKRITNSKGWPFIKIKQAQQPRSSNDAADRVVDNALFNDDDGCGV